MRGMSSSGVSVFRRALMFLAVWCGLMIGGIGTAQAREVRVGVYQNEPKIFLDAAGNPTGIMIDILERIARMEDWQLKYVQCTWQECLDALEAGKLDLMPDVAYSPQRDQIFDFHQTPALHSWSQVFSRPGVQINSIFDLNGKRVVVLSGSIQEQNFSGMIAGFGLKVRLLPATGFKEAFERVASGAADAVITNNIFGEFNASRYKLAETPVVFLPSRLFFATQAGSNGGLLTAIDTHLQAWQASPESEYTEILKKWRGASPAAVIPSYVWKILIGLLALLLLVSALALVLRWQVKLRTRHIEAEKAKVQASELKLKTILDSLDAYIYLKDLDGRYLFANQAVLNLWQTGINDVIGYGDEKFFDGVTATQVQVNDRQVMSSGELTRLHETAHVPATGATTIFLTTKLPLRDATGGIYALCGISVDITALKNAEAELAKYRDHLENLVAERTEQLTEAKQKAEAANVSKSAFLANMSHEIRTPLNAITGMAHLIRREGLSPQQDERLGKLEAAGEHLLEIINAVLDLSKIEAGKFSLEVAALRIDDVVNSVMVMVADSARAKHLGLKFERAPDLPVLLGDATRIKQALLNYATNAVKFTESGEIIVRVALIEDLAESVLLRLEVEDTGPGLSPEATSRLFSAFEQADNTITRKYGGTGLGLAIARKIAEAMEGSAGVDTELGKGSRFWLTVRLRKGDAVVNVAGALPEGEVESMLRSNYAGRRILLAEDEPINREIATMMLEDIGMVVDAVEDGAAALRLATANSYAVILTDMQMPTMDGLEATRQIRHLATYQTTPIIAMTANAFAEDRERCFTAGMNDFISKPVKPEILYATIYRWLSTSQ